jgi:DNA-directed RNA polymerase specialized sigma24 family protein
MEHTIEKLGTLEKRLIAMNVLEQYSVPEMSRLLGYSQRTLERLLHDAIDQLSSALLTDSLLERLPDVGNKGSN